MWRRTPQRPPPTYEDVRLVAEVLSRINVDLIERHFAIGADIAQQIMERLVGEKLFSEQQADGWHYPPQAEAAATSSEVQDRRPPP